jgi:HSP20 family molecular chaperone IbpA
MGTRNRQEPPEGRFLEPAAECVEDGNRVRVVVKLPGISETKIRVELDDGSLIIWASDGEKTYRKEIPISRNTRISRKKFQDGELELILEKTGS